MRDVLRGQLPPRYSPTRDEVFRRIAVASLEPGARVLDIGSGRHPTVEAGDRPAGTRYVGLDLSGPELARAPGSAYDDAVVADVARPVGSLVDGFDVAVSYQVLEHVKPLEAALENIRSYLRPGGRLVATFSGAFSVFGLANRLIPKGASAWILRHLLDREPDLIFPAHYDRCWFSALEAILRPWKEHEIRPFFTGADYFRFSRPLQALYLGYEEIAYRRGWNDLAAYYLVTATA
jgi:SAM-dependent methyltransferase